ncbi:MAG: DUF2318 domain-containing protein [DPANN group archaeon]|nr:DUF2318 domain-containing protein [DPANN group archaeon]
MNNKKIIIGILLAVALLSGIFLTKGDTQKITGQATISDDQIKISLSDISETAKWYTYEYKGTTIKYFIVKAEDGTIKTAFDACDVCFGAKKGYRQEGTDMICNNCGNAYNIIDLGTKNKKGGGCWPGYLESSIEGNDLILKRSDLEKDMYRFK